MNAMAKKAESTSAGHEKRDVNARGVAWFAAGLIFVIAIIFFAMRGLMGSYGKERNVANARDVGAQILPPEPRLQSDPATELARLRAQDKGLLESYGWVDRKAGVVRIPIERAMDLVAERGLPAPQFSSGKTPLQMRQEKGDARKLTP